MGSQEAEDLEMPTAGVLTIFQAKLYFLLFFLLDFFPLKY
jgi:hypothetical protein